MLVVTIKSKHIHTRTHILRPVYIYTYMLKKIKCENSVICDGCLKCSGSTEHRWNYTDRRDIEIPNLLPMSRAQRNRVHRNPNPKPESTELYIIKSNRN